jgi:riboflavin synthase
MFTGIIQQKAAVVAVDVTPTGKRLLLAADLPGSQPGDSLAVNGVCLTIAENAGKVLQAGRAVALDVVPETLGKTNLGRLVAGDWVHLERPLRVGDGIDGHFVQGHVDGLAELVARNQDNGDYRLTLRPPAGMMRLVSDKGSVALDGVSLTVASAGGDTFDVALVPTTLHRTALWDRPVGWPMNFEADILVKTVANWLQRSGVPGGASGERRD